VRRAAALALAAGLGGVAGAGLVADRQAQLGDRRLQVAVDVHRQRLQRRDVQRVQPLARPFGELDQRGQEPGQGFPAPGRRDQQRALPRRRGAQHGELVRVRHPPPLREPAGEQRREEGVGVGSGRDLGQRGVHGHGL